MSGPVVIPPGDRPARFSEDSMPRPSLEPLSQDRLASELKRWIDTARFALDDSRAYGRAVGEILALVRDHPVSALRPHVLHNLGMVRRRWLGQFSTKLHASIDLEDESLLVHLEEMGRWRVV
jgi:hypothetical protein